MFKLFFIFAIVCTIMGLGLPLFGITELPFWQVACGAAIPTAAIYFAVGNLI